MKFHRVNASRVIALELLAYADGFGVCLRYLEDARDKYQVTLRLPKEVLVTGKLKNPNADALANESLTLSSLRLTAEGVDNAYPFHDPPDGISAWPGEITTGRDGSFTVRGASSMTELTLELGDDRAARQRWEVAVGTDTPRTVVLQANLPRRVEGTVVAAGTNEPIADAIVRLGFANKDGKFLGHDFSITDDNGRFQVQCYHASRLNIRVNASGNTFEKLNRQIDWVEGTTIQGMTLPLDHDGFERRDGTTVDGQPASTIVSEHPQAEVTFLQPSSKLTTALTGTLFIKGKVTAARSNTPHTGLFAVDPRSGRWWRIARNVAWFRVSPNGRHIATTSETGQLQVIAIDPTAPDIDISTQIRDGGYRVSCWTPDSKSLILSKNAPQKRHYYGEEYWQLDTEKWQFDISNNGLKKLDLPARYDIWDVSPDGRQLALNWDTHAYLTGAQIHLANRDGSGLRPLAQKREQYYWYPRFSPDGAKVLAKHLDARAGGNRPDAPHTSIRTLALDGSHESSIQVSDEYMPEVASWSPNGEHIGVVAYGNAAFSGGSKQSKVFVVDAEGVHFNEVRLRNVDNLILHDIDWSPVILPPHWCATEERERVLD
jgi:hypothetical protein